MLRSWARGELNETILANADGAVVDAGFPEFEDMLKEWENSRGHRENLLIKGARRVGVAYADNPKSPYRKFWAMLITD
jgi:uncharacterized protein YkwD